MKINAAKGMHLQLAGAVHLGQVFRAKNNLCPGLHGVPPLIRGLV
jgi:hypothetical protein